MFYKNWKLHCLQKKMKSNDHGNMLCRVHRILFLTVAQNYKRLSYCAMGIQK